MCLWKCYIYVFLRIICRRLVFACILIHVYIFTPRRKVAGDHFTAQVYPGDSSFLSVLLTSIQSDFLISYKLASCKSSKVAISTSATDC